MFCCIADFTVSCNCRAVSVTKCCPVCAATANIGRASILQKLKITSIGNGRDASNVNNVTTIALNKSLPLYSFLTTAPDVSYDHKTTSRPSLFKYVLSYQPNAPP